MDHELLIKSRCEEFAQEIAMFEHYFHTVNSEAANINKKIVEEHERISSEYDYETGDDGVVWSQATANVMGSDAFPPYRHESALAGGYSIIIYHAFERFLELIVDYHLKEDFATIMNEPIDKKRKDKMKGIIDSSDKLETFDQLVILYPGIAQYQSYAKLRELCLVCNVFKHGSGRSMEALAALRPDLFRNSFMGISGKGIRPLSGWGVDLVKEDFDNYVNAIRVFLKEAFGHTCVKPAIS